MLDVKIREACGLSVDIEISRPSRGTELWAAAGRQPLAECYDRRVGGPSRFRTCL
jgi:hypothetical protein